jgi:hydrogenase nickel incorporation protein HypA/HybF
MPEYSVMPEYSIVEALFDQIRDAARVQGALAVRRVRVRIGEISGVDVDRLRAAYNVFRVRTLCDDAPIDIEAVAARWTCPEGHGDIALGRALVCPSCARPARLAAGDEIVLVQLEFEVP